METEVNDMTNRDKFNGIHNDVLADILCVANDGDIKCKFCCYKGDCFGKSCFYGIKAWLRTNRNKFNAMPNEKLADILKRAFFGDKCKFCSYSSEDCFETNKSCFDGIKLWLSAPGANEPENPPADKVDKPQQEAPAERNPDKTMINNAIADNVNHPSHYNRDGAMECIDEMLLLFGFEAVKYFCLCNIFKYRYRASDKNGLDDLKKSDWYVAKYKEIEEKWSKEKK